MAPVAFSGERAVYVQPDFFSDALFVRRLFGEYSFRSAADPAACDAIFDLLASGAIDRLVISNPYRDQHVQRLYQRVRAAALPLLIVERGTLPRSLFLDVSGFLRDSRSYDPEHWQEPLDEAERSRLEDYRAGVLRSDEALETQSLRAGLESTRKRLLNGRKRLCAVTLQMSTDAVTNHFTRPGMDYPRFKALIGEAIPMLEGDWAFAVKSHPREPLSAIGGVATQDDVNITDLIEASDAVLTFNSGTGVAAMMHGKPVGCFGDAFYGGNGLTASLASIDEMKQFLADPEKSHDADARDRFLHHLIFRLYSEVQFLGPLPGRRFSRPVAMQARIVRVYDPEAKQSLEYDRRNIGPLANTFDRETERLRAWYRAASNRVMAAT